MRSLWLFLFGRRNRGVPAVYSAGTLGGRAMPQPEIVSAVRAALTAPGEQGARAVVQKLEADAAWWSAWATHEEAVAKGMSHYYAGGAAALADVLNELRGWAEGEGGRMTNDE